MAEENAPQQQSHGPSSGGMRSSGPGAGPGGPGGPGKGRNRASGGAAGAVLPELLGGIEGKPVQIELSQVRVLLELLRFLLVLGDNVAFCNAA